MAGRKDRKAKKSTTKKTKKENGVGQELLANDISIGVANEASNMATNQTENVDLSLILKELRDFRKDNERQLKVIQEDINKTNKRIEEAEGRIEAVETRVQTAEEAVTELLKLQIHLDAKLTDLEGRSRRENIRLHGVKEGAEENAQSMMAYVEALLREKLELPPSFELRVERAHRAMMPKPPAEDAPPRSIVAKLSSFRMKEEIIKTAWKKRGFELHGRRVNIDHDYAPDVLKRRREYNEAKSLLRERKIRFQTPFPARMRVFYEEGTVLYGSAEEATGDMVKRGFPVTVIKQPDSLLERIQRFTWRGGQTNREGVARRSGNFRDRLRPFRREEK